MSSLSDFLKFTNGRTPPTRSDTGQYRVYGANGPIGCSETFNFNGPAIVIGRVGSFCGNVQYTEKNFWSTDNTIVAKSANPKEGHFWKGFLQNLGLRNFARGSGQPLLTQSDLKQISVNPPSTSIRVAISDILGSLDDKIAANLTAVQKTNALAIALVGMRSQDASQTPLSELTSQISRGVAPKYDDSGKYMVLNQKCIRDSQVDIARARLMKSLPKSPGKVLRQNDVLVNSTGQGTLGRIARWTSSEPDTSVDTHVSIVRFDPEVADPAFAGTVLSTMERLVEDLAEGSTGQTELKRDLLGSLELILPPLEVQREVGQQIELLDELCRTRIEENLILAKTRDELLPLLMSGKITVKEAEQEAAGAGAEVQSEENEG